MGHVLSAPAPALIHHPEPSSVSFRWRNPKQGELITAAPDFGQVASRPPDIHAGSGGSEFTTTGSLPPPPPPRAACSMCLLSYQHQPLVLFQHVRKALLGEISRLEGEGNL